MALKDKIAFFDEIEEILKNQNHDLVDLSINHSVVLRQQIFRYGLCIHESRVNLFEKEKEYSYFDYIDSFTLLNPTRDKFLSKSVF